MTSTDTTVELALAQLPVEPADPATNRERAAAAVERAADDGADLVVLPELFTVGYFAFDEYERSAEPLEGATVGRLREVAREREVAILCGSFVEDLAASAAEGFDTPAPEGYANTSVLLDSDGTHRHTYRKHHLFGYESRESALLTAGQRVETVEWRGFTVGVTTCYDLRFPSLYRQLLDAGATLFLVPSAWPYPRVEHWRVLPRARAIENLCYVAAANGVGEFDGGTLLGRTAVYDPWGTAIAQTGDEPDMVRATLDPATVESRREEFPALADRR